jgi:nitroreductase
MTDIIRLRRSIFPPMYDTERNISDDILHEILENANHAPNHKLTEPWRFKILRGSARQRLADFLIDDYRHNTPAEEQTEKKIQKMTENPMRSNCIILICMQRHEGTLPEWEELAAVAMAVQNMWLTCTAHGIGTYWSTPAAIQRMRQFIPLEADERCLGIMYMGYSKVNAADIPVKRTPIEDKVTWVEA